MQEGEAMIDKFISTVSPTTSQIAAIEQLTPQSPFNSEHYSSALVEVGLTPCLFGIERDSKLVSGCLGFFKRGALSSNLEIISVPGPTQPNIFWEGIFDFCRHQKFWDLDIRTYASDLVNIPSWAGETSRRKRCEFVLDLSTPDIMQEYCSRHKRDVKRSQKAGLTIRRTRDPKLCMDHLQIIGHSMDRRKARGERIEGEDTDNFFKVLLQVNAAEIFQALNGEKILSSILILRGPTSAYYQSGGSHPDGMALGASKFLFTETANILRQEGTHTFNLGGVGEDEEGLREFKAGFGGQPLFSEEASFNFASPLQKKLRATARQARNVIATLTQKSGDD
jgi:hypothetical protein